MTLSHLTESRRHEFGGGLLFTGAGTGISSSPRLFENGSMALIPNVFYRINSDPLGPGRNVILYAGGQVGVAVTTLRAERSSASTASVAYGPQVGALFFFSRTVALQLENQLNITEQKSIDSSGNKMALRNFFTVGIRLLF